VPETISDTRQLLTSHVARFREEGLGADPVVFGDHRQPEAALIPYETFRLLLDVAELAVEGEPEHRIVVREAGGRLDDPVRRSEAQRRVARIRRLLDRDRSRHEPGTPIPHRRAASTDQAGVVTGGAGRYFGYALRRVPLGEAPARVRVRYPATSRDADG